MRGLLSISIGLCSVLALSACGLGDPSPVGRGYSSYENVSKSAPGPKARGVGYHYTVVQNEAVLADLDGAVQDLLDRLEGQAVLSMTDVYLEPATQNAFDQSVDHLLRQEMIERGYQIVSSPGAASVALKFMASEDQKASCNKRDGFGPVYMSLAMNTPGSVAETVIGDYYDVPRYGLSSLQNRAFKVLCPTQ